MDGTFRPQNSEAPKLRGEREGAHVGDGLDGGAHVVELLLVEPVPQEREALAKINLLEFPSGPCPSSARSWPRPRSGAPRYWQGSDEHIRAGDGVFLPVERGEPDAGWIAYLVAEK